MSAVPDDMKRELPAGMEEIKSAQASLKEQGLPVNILPFTTYKLKKT